MFKVLVAITALGFTACASTPRQYFPDTAFQGDPDPYYAELYETFLTGMREPSLIETDPEQSLYRLTIVSYSADPIHTIRINKRRDGTGRLTFKAMDAGWGQKGRRTLEKTQFRQVSNQDMSTLSASLDTGGFWQKTYSPSDDFCMHASFFLFEVTENGRYHAVSEDGCFAGASAGNLILNFYELAGLSDPEDWSLLEYFGSLRN